MCTFAYVAIRAVVPNYMVYFGFTKKQHTHKLYSRHELITSTEYNQFQLKTFCEQKRAWTEHTVQRDIYISQFIMYTHFSVVFLSLRWNLILCCCLKNSLLINVLFLPVTCQKNNNNKEKRIDVFFLVFVLCEFSMSLFVTRYFYTLFLSNLFTCHFSQTFKHIHIFGELVHWIAYIHASWQLRLMRNKKYI